MEKRVLKTDENKNPDGSFKKPQVMTGVIRNKKGEIDRYALTEFVPGKIITRCGRKYQLMPDGSQRKIKQ
jgi:hypothetical protein